MKGHSNTGDPDVDPRRNYLLRGLSDSEYDRLRPSLEPVRLPRPTELEAANEPVRFVYFSRIHSILMPITMEPAARTADSQKQRDHGSRDASDLFSGAVSSTARSCQRSGRAGSRHSRRPAAGSPRPRLAERIALSGLPG